jgi:hypothetical protein
MSAEKCNQRATDLKAFESESGRHSEYCPRCDKVHFMKYFLTPAHRKASAEHWANRVHRHFKSHSLLAGLIQGVK